jgi:heme-degrading monooxygenase HmoA
LTIVIVNHFVKAGRVDAAVKRINTNGERMAEVPGFLFRYLLASDKDALKISTVTGWDEPASYDRWNVLKKTLDTAPASPDDSPYERVVNEVHTVKNYDVAKAAV